jgi:multiple sugar transport system substrate-binding protein
MRRSLTGPGIRVLLISISLACAAGCVTACGTRPFPPSADRDPVITILTGTDTSVSGIYQQLAHWWKANEGSTHITIKLDMVPGGATEAHAEMLAAAQGGERFDIYNLDNEWTTEFADSGYIRPLAGRLSLADFLAGPRRSAEDASGRAYAVPFTTDVGLLFYNKKLVTPAQVGELRSLSGVVKLAASTMASKGAAEGYAGQFSSYEGLTVNALEAINHNSTGRPAFGGNGTVTDSASLTAGLRQLVSGFSTVGRVVNGVGQHVVPPRELSYDEQQAFSDFAAGHTVFMRNWPIKDELFSRAGGPGLLPAGDVGVAPLPFPSVLGGQNLAIAAGSRNPAAALEVIKFLTSEPAERCLFAVGGFPATRRAAYTASGLPQGYQQVKHRPLCGQQPGASMNIGGTILTALGRVVPRPATRYYSGFTDVIQACVTRLLKTVAGPPAAPQAAVTRAITVAARSITADLQAASTGHGAPGCPAP